MNNCGVVYVAVDPESSPSPFKFNSAKKSILRDVMASIKSLRRSNPSIKITVFSDFKEILDSGSNDYTPISIENDYGFLPKVFGILNSPYEKTIFLDCDTHIQNDISTLFTLLVDDDICIGREFLNPHILNTGVVSFNNSLPRVRSFLKSWYESMVNTKSKAISSQKTFSNKTPDDQGHFNQIYKLGFKNANGRPKRIRDVISLSKSISFHILDTKIWNCRNSEYNTLKKENWDFSKTKIFHMRGFKTQ